MSDNPIKVGGNKNGNGESQIKNGSNANKNIKAQKTESNYSPLNTIERKIIIKSKFKGHKSIKSGECQLLRL